MTVVLKLIQRQYFNRLLPKGDQTFSQIILYRSVDNMKAQGRVVIERTFNLGSTLTSNCRIAGTLPLNNWKIEHPRVAFQYHGQIYGACKEDKLALVTRSPPASLNFNSKSSQKGKQPTTLDLRANPNRCSKYM